MLRGLLVFICLGLGSWAAAQASGETEKSIDQGTLENRVKALASIQPGLAACRT